MRGWYTGLVPVLARPCESTTMRAPRSGTASLVDRYMDSRGLLLALVVTSSLGAACGSSTPEARGEGVAPGVGKSPGITSLLAFDVVAPTARAKVLRTYCSGTQLDLQDKDNQTHCGPFLSRFEASFIAGLTPGAKVELRDRYDEPADPEVWRRQPESPNKIPSYVGMRELAGHRFALVSWDLDGSAASALRDAIAASRPPGVAVPGADDAPPADSGEPLSEIELFESRAQGARFIARVPKLNAYVESAGVFAALANNDLTYLQVSDAGRTTTSVKEKVVAWRFAAGGRDTLFERPILDLSVPRDKEPVIQVTRLAPEPNGFQLSTFKVTFTVLPDGKIANLLMNSWNDPHYKSKPDLPELVEIQKVEAIGKRSESLDAMD